MRQTVVVGYPSSPSTCQAPRDERKAERQKRMPETVCIKRWILAGGVTLVAALAGCSNMGTPSIHNDGRSKQADAAVAAWKAFDVSSFLSAQQKRQDAQRDEDVATVDAIALSNRDSSLRSIVGSSIGKTINLPPPQGAGGKKLPPVPPVPAGIGAYIEAKLRAELVGKPGADTKPTAKSYADIKKAVDDLRVRNTADDADKQVFVTYDIDFKHFHMPGPPRCSDLLPPLVAGTPRYSDRVQLALDKLPSSKDANQVRLTLEAMRRDSCNGRPPFDILAEFGPDGALPNAFNEYKAALEAEKVAEKNATAAQDEYLLSKKAYEDKVASAGTGKSAAESVLAASTRLGDAVKKLESSSASTKGLTARFISQERLKSLDDFLSTVNTNVAQQTVPANTPKAATAAILLPGLVDGVKKTIADGKVPLSLPLLIKRDQEDLKSQAAALEVAGWKAEIALKKQLYETLLGEAVALSAAHDDLVTAEGQTKDFNAMSFADAAADSAKSRPLKSATLRYLDVIGGSDAQRHKIEYQIIDAQYAQGLAKDTLTLKQWSSLITLTTGQVADYYTGGITVDEIIQIAHLLGIAWIGHGVNK